MVCTTVTTITFADRTRRSADEFPDARWS